MKDYTYLHDTMRMAALNFSIAGLFLVNSHNSNALFNFKGKLYFMNNEWGIHKSGSIDQIVQHRSNTINILPIADFETSPDLRNTPQAMVTKGNRIYVVTDKGFYIIKHHKNQEILKDMFWESLAPRSIAVIGRKEIYVGIRGGYVKIDPLSKTYAFYKYNK